MYFKKSLKWYQTIRHTLSQTSLWTQGTTKHMNQVKTRYRKFWLKTILPFPYGSRAMEVIYFCLQFLCNWDFLKNLVIEHFANKHHQVQETCGSCFGCCSYAAFVLAYFLRTNGPVTLFRTETIVASFLHLTVLKVLNNYQIGKAVLNDCWVK